MGIGNDTQVVAYDEANGSIAARLWWMLRWLGHDAAPSSTAVSRRGLLAAERCSRARPTRRRREGRAPFHAADRRGLRREHGGTRARIAGRKALLVDARAKSDTPGGGTHRSGGRTRTRRRESSLYRQPRRGRPFSARRRARAPLAGTSTRSDLQNLVAMCGSGVTACHNLLSLEVAGLTGGKLYAGSWSEWIRDPRRPVVRG